MLRQYLRGLFNASAVQIVWGRTVDAQWQWVGRDVEGSGRRLNLGMIPALEEGD
jgi:hypothetical protein